MFNDTVNFYNLINTDNIFWFSALAGSGMFIIQFLLNFIDVRDYANASHSKLLSPQACLLKRVSYLFNYNRASRAESTAKGLGCETLSGCDHTQRRKEDFEDRSFKRMSVQAVAGFLMIFGWTAISCQREGSFQEGSTLAIAFVAGLFALFITSAIFKVAKKLQSRGS